MILFIIIYSILTLLAGLGILIKPGIIFSFLLKHLDKLIFHIFAVIIRLILGTFLILESDVSKFPSLIEVFGWLSISAALIIAIIGRSLFNSVMRWALSIKDVYVRLSGIVAILYGAFLIYAFS